MCFTVIGLKAEGKFHRRPHQHACVCVWCVLCDNKTDFDNVKELAILLCVNGTINVHYRFPMKPCSNLDAYTCYTVC